MNKYLFPILILFFSLVAIFPLLQPGFFSFHDNTQVQRVYEMHRALADGHFPVRWVQNLGYGYGYPIFNFYAPFAYYVGGLSAFFVDSLIATKVMMIIGIVLAGVGMYLFSKEFFGKAGGLVSGILYLYAPYHALDIYVRGDVAEFYATAFIPFVFYALWRLMKKASVQHAVFVTLSYALLIISHNLTALMVTPFIIAFVVVSVIYLKLRTVRAIGILAISLLLGIGVAGFYVIPVFAEMKYTNVLSVIGGGSHFADHYICPNQLWSSPIGYLGSVKGCIDGMSFQLGKAHFLLSILAIVGVFTLRKKKSDQLYIVVLGSLALVVSLLLTLNISDMVWRTISVMSYFQFPWRFLIMSTFFASFIAGGTLWALEQTFLRKGTVVVGVILCVMLIGYYNKYFLPEKIVMTTEEEYVNKQTLLFTTSKISDEYMPPLFQRPTKEEEVVTERFNIVQGNGTLVVKEDKTQKKVFTTVSSSTLDIVAKIAPYPSWQATVDDKQVAIKATNHGYRVSVPEGRHSVTFEFRSTPAQLLGNSISIASILSLILGIIYRPAFIFHEKKR